MISNIISDLKLAIKLISYSLDIKIYKILMIIGILVGVVTDILCRGEGWFSLWFIALIPTWATQYLNSIALASLAQSSAKKRSILINMPTLLTGMAMLIGYTFVTIVRLSFLLITGSLNRMAIYGFFLFGLFAIFLTFYNTLIFRKPAIGYIILVPICLILTMGQPFISSEGDSTRPLYWLMSLPCFDNLAVSFAMGLILVILSIVIFYALSSALYKMPLSERVYKSSLNRAKKKK